MRGRAAYPARRRSGSSSAGVLVDSSYRRKGVCSIALGGALEEIGRSDAGTVHRYPEDTDSRQVSGVLLHNGTLAMFKSHGFERTRRIGEHRWVVARVMRPLRE